MCSSPRSWGPPSSSPASQRLPCSRDAARGSTSVRLNVGTAVHLVLWGYVGDTCHILSLAVERHPWCCTALCIGFRMVRRRLNSPHFTICTLNAFRVQIVEVVVFAYICCPSGALLSFISAALNHPLVTAVLPLSRCSTPHNDLLYLLEDIQLCSLDQLPRWCTILRNPRLCRPAPGYRHLRGPPLGLQR